MHLLTVVYHYIDNEEKYRAGIYPTSPERLANQIENIQKKHTFITEADLLRAFRGEKELPEYSCLLTFDDGLKSQFEAAREVLEKYQTPALFFIPTRHLIESKGYLVHKVHYLLSQVGSEELLKSIEEEYQQETKKNIDWSSIDMSRVLGWYRYDNEPTAKFKFLMNHFLEAELVENILDRIFLHFYLGTEKEFCDTLYMSQADLLELQKHPLISLAMHTHTHLNIPGSSEEKVYNDIKKCFETLESILGQGTLKGLSYPYGSITEKVYQHKTKRIIHNLGLSYAFTTEKILTTNLDHPFLLGRFGTNDITGGKRPIFTV